MRRDDVPPPPPPRSLYKAPADRHPAQVPNAPPRPPARAPSVTPPAPVRRSFLLLFSSAVCAVLEQPTNAKALTGALKDVLWKLVALPVEHYGQAEATTGTLVELLLGHEHLAAPLAELTQKLLEEHDGVPSRMERCRALGPSPQLAPQDDTARLPPPPGVQPVVAFLRQLATLAHADLGADAAGPKNLATFLIALAEMMRLGCFAYVHRQVLSDELSPTAMARGVLAE